MKITGYIPQKDIEVNYRTADQAVAIARFKKRYPKGVVSMVEGVTVVDPTAVIEVKIDNKS